MRNLFIYPTVAPEVEQRTSLKRTGVQIMPRAIPCTSSCDLAKGSSHASSLGAFAPTRVRARKL